MNESHRSVIRAWVEQDREWQRISDELRTNGKAPSAADITNEQQRRLWKRGERRVTYEEIMAAAEALTPNEIEAIVRKHTP